MKFRIMALVLCCVLLVYCFSPVAALGADLGYAEGQKDVLTVGRAVKAKDISANLRSQIQACGVELEDHSEIKLVPMEQDNTVNALVITTVNGNSATVDTFVSVGCQGEFVDVCDTLLRSNRTRDGSSSNLPQGYATYVRASAIYDAFFYGAQLFVRPISELIICHVRDGDTLTNVNIDFITTGFQYSYPGFEDLTNNDEIYDHVISVSQRTPTPNQYYLTERPYPSNRVLQVSTGGGGMLGMAFTFAMKLNGETLWGSVQINVE